MHHQGTKAQRRAQGRETAVLRRLISGFPLVPLCLGGVALAICLSAYLPTAFLAQQKPSTPVSKSPQQAFILRSTTNEVLVDVRVYDKSGKPVTDLKQSDFRVTEDGVPQTISDFSLENVEKLAQATGGNEQAQVIDLAKLPPEVERRAGASGSSTHGLFL